MSRESEDALLQAVIDDPDDDAVRLVYADFLEDHGQPARADFIRVQIELARDPRRGDLEARELALVKEHESTWVGSLRGLVLGGEFHPPYCFRRGFVEEATLSAEDFLT